MRNYFNAVTRASNAQERERERNFHFWHFHKIFIYMETSYKSLIDGSKNIL